MSRLTADLVAQISHQLGDQLLAFELDTLTAEKTKRGRIGEFRGMIMVVMARETAKCGMVADIEYTIFKKGILGFGRRINLRSLGEFYEIYPDEENG